MRASRGDLLLGRFWSKVKPSDFCWEWMGGRTAERGYGQLKVEGRMRLAHRVSWELANGPIPKDIDVLHSCDNPRCVRVSHLFLGTQRDNARDMVAKGRGLTPEQQAAINHPKGDGHWTHLHPERVRRGASHHRAKLTDAIVREIRQLRAAGVTYAAIAEQFGISQGTIAFVMKGTTWTHVE